MSVKSWLSRDAARRVYDAIVVDPPRRGLEKETLAWLCARPFGELRYVSCDPVTLARDAARLVSSGWALRSLELYDFYPQTSHIETSAVFFIPSLYSMKQLCYTNFSCRGSMAL
jgi:23S rRNA (uracil1939-C5)-methyltransferase